MCHGLIICKTLSILAILPMCMLHNEAKVFFALQFFFFFCIIDNLSEDLEFRSPSFFSRNIMAEPDYIDEENPELIRPQKLINPVKSSRNHQDLHRELRMNQKR